MPRSSLPKVGRGGGEEAFAKQSLAKVCGALASCPP